MAEEKAKASKVSQGNNLFSIELYKNLTRKDENIFFSPLSVYTILSLIHQGAAGKTKEALDRALHLPQEEAQEGFKFVMFNLNNIKNVTLLIANKVYIQQNYKMKSSFRKIAVNNYFADCELLNFADNVNSAATINKWVEDKTNKKITNLIQPGSFNSLTRMVLVNAIYFKGAWLRKFKKDNTKKEKFYINNNDSVDVDMMYQERSFRYCVIEDLDIQVLELPYASQYVSMIIILPKKRDGISDLEKKLESFDLNSLDKQLRTSIVKVHLPKFKIETTLKLKKPLKELGLTSIFEESDFSGLLDGDEPVNVSEVIQKTFIEVNEEGSEAAAGTLVRCKMCAWSVETPEPVTFNADHPFIVELLHTKNNTNILFMGKINSIH